MGYLVVMWRAAGTLLLALALLHTQAAVADDIVFRDSFNGPDFPLCGNHLVEGGETCDGNCPICGVEAYSGYTQSGTDDTCDVRCHVPIQSCQNGDGACPFVAATGGATCGSANDAECTGPSWRSVALQPANYSAMCTTVRAYGISAGGRYVFTTCSPPASAAGTGDPEITTVADSLGTGYNVGNDDCEDPTALPQLAGWNCNNAAGFTRMSCASPNPDGFIALPGTTRLDITICPVNGSGGSATLYIWYNAPSVPNPG